MAPTVPVCPACGGRTRPAGTQGTRTVCERCGTCREADGAEVDSIACPGCPARPLCESCPTWLAQARTSVQELRDGSRVLIRPLLYRDRDELARHYEALSAESRRLRFFSAPAHLSEADLDYLTNLDYDDRFAFGAWAIDELGAPGVGVARYIRDRRDPTLAEAAVTVVDDHQGRGIATLLLGVLAAEAAEHGIRAFTAEVLWENRAVLDAIGALGARIEPSEPGVAHVEVDLPAAEQPLRESKVFRMLRLIAERAGVPLTRRVT